MGIVLDFDRLRAGAEFVPLCAGEERQQGVCCKYTRELAQQNSPGVQGWGAEGRGIPVTPVPCIPPVMFEAVGREGGTGKSVLETPGIAVGSAQPRTQAEMGRNSSHNEG